MLSKEQILEKAVAILLKEDYPINIASSSVTMPEDDTDEDPETKDFLKDNNIAEVSFRSKYFDDPNEEHPCDPGVFIVYIDITTGEAHIPRHM